MLKKAVAAAAIGAGLMLVGTPAFAGAADDAYDMVAIAAEHEGDTDQLGLINLNDSELLSDINVCHLDVNVIAVPILSGNDEGSCSNPDVEVVEAHNDGHGHHGHHGHHGKG